MSEVWLLTETLGDSMSPFGAKKSIGATEEAKFHCRDSFVAVDGRWILKGRDMLEQRRKILERDGYTCQECKSDFHGYGYCLEIDHIVKRSRSRDDRMENLRTLCFVCHRRRHNGQAG